MVRWLRNEAEQGEWRGIVGHAGGHVVQKLTSVGPDVEKHISFTEGLNFRCRGLVAFFQLITGFEGAVDGEDLELRFRRVKGDLGEGDVNTDDAADAFPLDGGGGGAELVRFH